MAAGSSMLKKIAELEADAHLTMFRGEHAAAESKLRKLVQLRQRALGPEHEQTLGSQTSHAAALSCLGRHAEAETIFRDVLQVKQQSPEFGMEHESTLQSVYALGSFLVKRDRFKEAEPMLRSVHALDVRVLGPRHEETLTIQTTLGQCLVEDGQFEEAEVLLRDALEGFQAWKASPERAHHKANKIGLCMLDLAGCMFRAGRHVEAEPRLRAAVSHNRHQLGEGNHLTIASMSWHAQSLDKLGRHAEAEVMHRLTAQGNIAKRGWDSPETQSSIQRYVECLVAQQKTAAAEALLRDTLSHLQQALGEDHLTALEWMKELAKFLLSQGDMGKHGVAKALLRRARELARNRQG